MEKEEWYLRNCEQEFVVEYPILPGRLLPSAKEVLYNSYNGAQKI